MKASLTQVIRNIEIENKTILQISKEIGGNYDLNEISREVVKIRESRSITPKNTFGNCGINPDANPCGDADEY